MPRNGRLVELLTPSPAEDRPLYVQVCSRIRDLIAAGSLAPGERLPSARVLARDLGLSRTTVETAYSRLVAEGFLERRVGAGSFVADTLANGTRARVGRNGVHPDGQPGERRALYVRGRAEALSARGRAIRRAGGEVRESPDLRLSNCVPDVDLFPMRIWSRLLARAARRASAASLRRADPAGHEGLRRAIASYVAAARGVRCEPAQVFVVSGTQQALDLLARLLCDSGDAVWIEDPHYLGARAAFAAAEVEMIPVPVDDEGLDVARAEERRPAARLVYLTPSHQFPTGVPLSAPRRLAVLEWARRTGAWVLEDDYDSEFRYGGRPLTCLQGLDTDGGVIYVGTFNKSLFPTLRSAFVVAPPSLVEPLRAALLATGAGPPLLHQAALADFIDEGHLGRHIRRLRERYGARRAALARALERRLRDRTSGDGAFLGRARTGLHFVLHLPGRDDVELSRRAAEAGLDLPALSRYHLGPRPRTGLLVTFGSEPVERAEETAARIEGLL